MVFLTNLPKENAYYLIDKMKKTALFLSVFILFSCTSNTIFKKPENVIPKDTMVALLTDLYIAAAAKTEKNIHLEKKVNYLPLVYNIYKIDSVRFKESSFYYLSLVDEYEEMLQQVNDNLKKQKEVLESSLKKLSDSLKKR